MANLRIEPRADGSLLLTRVGGARWVTAVAGIGAGGLVLAGVLAGQMTLIGSVVALPLGVIAVLAGLGAARHRDWIVFDRRAREAAFRRGLGSMFRPVSAVPFDEIEAILIEGPEGGDRGYEVELRRAGDFGWPIDVSSDPAYVSRLVTALHEVGGWPVIRGGVPQRPPYRVGSGSRA
ncbi:MAG TPA: hypothetical protein VGW35_22180 [Methylomirabilota bacterium]|jgi:hypothetical protein|nr:hypothetical protein [Methylomirabilota bacterium]